MCPGIEPVGKPALCGCGGAGVKGPLSLSRSLGCCGDSHRAPGCSDREVSLTQHPGAAMICLHGGGLQWEYSCGGGGAL